MASKQQSFEKFFYTNENAIRNIEIVIDYADKHEGDYSPYKGHMLCPECQTAELTFVHKSSIRRAHLKKIPSTDYLEDCSYNFDYASKKLIKKYIDDLTSNQVQDRLNAIMNILFGDRKKITTINGNTNYREAKDNPLLFQDVINNKPTDFKALRRKRLADWIDESDGTDLHLFYGKVKLSIEEKTATNKNNEEYSYYLLKLRTQNKKSEWKYRTSIYRGSIRDEIDEQKIYQIALIGNLNFKYKWWSTDLINKSAIRYKEIS